MTSDQTVHVLADPPTYHVIPPGLGHISQSVTACCRRTLDDLPDDDIITRSQMDAPEEQLCKGHGFL